MNKIQADVGDYATNLPGEWLETMFPADFITTVRTAIALGKAVLVHIGNEGAQIGEDITLTAIDQVLEVDP